MSDAKEQQKLICPKCRRAFLVEMDVILATKRVLCLECSDAIMAQVEGITVDELRARRRWAT